MHTVYIALNAVWMVCMVLGSMAYIGGAFHRWECGNGENLPPALQGLPLKCQLVRIPITSVDTAIEIMTLNEAPNWACGRGACTVEPKRAFKHARLE